MAMFFYLVPSFDTSTSGVIKKILKEVEGSFTANESANVTVSYIGLLEDGTVFQKRGIGETRPLKFVTDEEQIITRLDRAIATMKKGERVIISIHPDYAFGNVEATQDFAIVPAGSKVVYYVKMMDFIKKTPRELNNSEKIEMSGRKKYDKATDFVREDGSFGDDELKLAKALGVSCWLNGATCCLKLNDFPKAIKL